MRTCDRVFWILLRRLWTKWSDALVIVKPDTIVRWHRAGFRLFWSWVSRRPGRQGRPAVDAEVALPASMGGHVVKAMGIAPTRTSYSAPWQNTASVLLVIAERARCYRRIGT